jgi:hypothetical protein
MHLLQPAAVQQDSHSGECELVSHTKMKSESTALTPTKTLTNSQTTQQRKEKGAHHHHTEKHNQKEYPTHKFC